jgi:hypothetical protein
MMRINRVKIDITKEILPKWLERHILKLLKKKQPELMRPAVILME